MITELLERRMQAQFFAPRELASAIEVVEYFAAIQGQEYEQTKWGISLRRPGAVDADIQRELDAGTILRSHLLRPTWHVVARADIRWLLELTAPRVDLASGTMYRKLELNRADFAAAQKIIVAALRDGSSMTRDELGKLFREHGIEAEGLRLIYLLMKAELDGVVSSGPRRGRQHTYKLLEAPAASLSRDEALVLLATRYFTSRGPATIEDFSTWSGLTQREARQGLLDCSPSMSKLEAEDKVYYFRDRPEPVDKEEVFLLPIYDEYIMGYKDRSMYLPAPASATRYDCMIMRGGRIVGTWKRLWGAELRVFLDHFQPPSNKMQSLVKRGLRSLSRFHGKPLVVE